jgi:hypothetical protein
MNLSYRMVQRSRCGLGVTEDADPVGACQTIRSGLSSCAVPAAQTGSSFGPKGGQTGAMPAL